MKAFKYKTNEDKESKFYDDLPSFLADLPEKDKVIQYSSVLTSKKREEGDEVHPDFLMNLLKSSLFSEASFTDGEIYDLLKGKSYISKRVTTEYLIVHGDGVDRTHLFNDDYLKSFKYSETPLEEVPEEYRFVQRGNNIITEKEYLEDE